MTSRPTVLAGTHTVSVRRLLKASRETIFSLWTDAQRMPDWILQGGSATLDVRVGGSYHMDMHYNGKSYPHDGEYLEIVPPSRLVFTWISEGTNGKPSIVTIELFERGDQTEFVLTHEGLPDAESAESHRQGWEEIVTWSEEQLPS